MIRRISTCKFSNISAMTNKVTIQSNFQNLGPAPDQERERGRKREREEESGREGEGEGEGEREREREKERKKEREIKRPLAKRHLRSFCNSC